MDAYTVSLTLGAAGHGVMAVGGLAANHGHHGHHDHGADAGGHHGGHGHAHGHSHGHASDVSLGTHGGAHAHGGVHGASAATSTAGAGGSGVLAHGVRGGSGGARGGGRTAGLLWSVLSPRVLFSVLVGLGATGVLARNALGGVALFALALVGGVAFEALLVRPLWNFAFRFASAPALTLGSALFDEARAPTRFDANGQGLIAVEVDGQMVQVLGTLRPEDRTTGVRIEEVDEERGRCVVSRM
jgi:hypothetical protein